MGALTIALLAACGSANDAPFGEGSTSAPLEPSGGDAGDAGDGGDGGAAACPASPPQEGASCGTERLTCAWGSDPRYGCRTVARCRNQTWQVFAPSCPAPPPACPASAPAGRDGGAFYPSCRPEDLGLTCVYGATAFTCSVCNGDFCLSEHGELAYQWFETTLQAGCPEGMPPNFGDACGPSGLVCDYNHCANTDTLPEVPSWGRGVGLLCQDGYWTWWNLDNGAFACP